MSIVTEREAEAKYPTYRAGGAKDHLAWARRIVFRVDDRGEKSIMKCQIDAARLALKNHQEESN